MTGEFAHIRGNRLVADHQDAKELLEKLGSEPKRGKGDVFSVNASICSILINKNDTNLPQCPFLLAGASR